MTRFEEQLKQALKREEPPAGFAERVMAKIPERKPGWKSFFSFSFQFPYGRLAMAGALALVLAVSVAIHTRQEMQEKLEGERARTQVMTALRIASTKLNITRQKVQSIGRDLESEAPAAENDSLKSKI
jgi:hypothetical protein